MAGLAQWWMCQPLLFKEGAWCVPVPGTKVVQRRTGSVVTAREFRPYPRRRAPYLLIFRMQRFTISLDDELADEFERYMHRAGYANRSEAIRDMLYIRLGQQREQADHQGDCMAVLSYVSTTTRAI
jgi:hypothetical protein